MKLIKIEDMLISVEDMLTIAKHKHQDPILAAFKHDFFIAYVTDISIRSVTRIKKRKIINGCLITKGRLFKRIIPLHPLVLSLIQHPKYQETPYSIYRERSYIQQMVQEAGITTGSWTEMSGQRSRVVHKYHHIYPDGLSLTALVHKRLCGFTSNQLNLLVGHRLENPKESLQYKKKLDRIFSKTFYDCLKYITLEE